MISGRTDLRTGVSGAKFDAEADFEVRLPLAAPKPRKNSEKRIFRLKIWIENFVFRDFRQDSEELEANGPQNQLAHQILLQIHLTLS